MTMLSAKDIPNLLSIGYILKNNTLALPGGHAGDAIKEPSVIKILEGRLSNVAYMARAIDIFDQAEEKAEGTMMGKKQFDHLMNQDRLRSAAHVYIGLRRAQRTSNMQMLRIGLSLLVAAEKGLMTMQDVARLLTPDLADEKAIPIERAERLLA